LAIVSDLFDHISKVLFLDPSDDEVYSLVGATPLGEFMILHSLALQYSTIDFHKFPHACFSFQPFLCIAGSRRRLRPTMGLSDKDAPDEAQSCLNVGWNSNGELRASLLNFYDA
jgi:hypothetical protein